MSLMYTTDRHPYDSFALPHVVSVSLVRDARDADGFSIGPALIVRLNGGHTLTLSYPTEDEAERAIYDLEAAIHDFHTNPHAPSQPDS